MRCLWSGVRHGCAVPTQCILYIHWNKRVLHFPLVLFRPEGQHIERPAAALFDVRKGILADSSTYYSTSTVVPPGSSASEIGLVQQWTRAVTILREEAACFGPGHWAPAKKKLQSQSKGTWCRCPKSAHVLQCSCCDMNRLRGCNTCVW